MNTTRNPLSLLRPVLIWFTCAVFVGVTCLANMHISQYQESSDELFRVCRQLDNVPQAIGNWTGVDQEIPREHLQLAGATGSLARCYTHESTGDQVYVTLLCGPHGPISLHPPTVCFTTAGWTVRTEPRIREQNFAAETAGFWECQFERELDFRNQILVTDWSWNNGEKWTAAEDPRFEFAGSAYLLKLYVSREATQNQDTHERRNAFISQLLKSIDESIF